MPSGIQQFEADERHGSREAAWGDTDDREIDAVDLLADEVRIEILRTPLLVGDDRHRDSGTRTLFFWKEGASRSQRYPQRVEVVGGDQLDEDAAHGLAGRRPSRGEGMCGEPFEHVGLLANIDQLGYANARKESGLSRSDLKTPTIPSPLRRHRPEEQELTMVKVALLAPIPTARTRIATAVKPRALTKVRRAWRRSWSSLGCLRCDADCGTKFRRNQRVAAIAGRSCPSSGDRRAR